METKQEIASKVITDLEEAKRLTVKGGGCSQAEVLLDNVITAFENHGKGSKPEISLLDDDDLDPPLTISEFDAMINFFGEISSDMKVMGTSRDTKGE